MGLAPVATGWSEAHIDRTTVRPEIAYLPAPMVAYAGVGRKPELSAQGATYD